MITRNHILSQVIVLLLMGSANGYAQEWKTSTIDELKGSIGACQKNYEEYTHMRLVTHVDAYLSATDRTPHQRTTSTLYRMGDLYLSEYMDIRTYQDKELRVTVDQDRKSILLSTPEYPQVALQGGLQDSVLSRATRIGRALLPDGTHYRLMFGGVLGFDAIEVVFDQKGWMRRIEMDWAHDVDLRYRDPSAELVRPRVVMELGIPERIERTVVDADPRSVVRMTPNGPLAQGVWKDYDVFDTRVP